jgi:hypothetical protein
VHFEKGQCKDDVAAAYSKKVHRRRRRFVHRQGAREDPGVPHRAAAQ